MASKGPKEHKTIYQRVAATLRERISDETYTEGELIPPEVSLAVEFDVSRHTMREALKELVLEGLIERAAGRGTVVSPRSAFSGSWGIKSLEGLIVEHVASDITVLQKGLVDARAHPSAAASLGLSKNASLYRMKRLMSSESGPAIVNTIYTLRKYSSRLPDEMIGLKSMVILIEQYCRIQPARARQVSSAVSADAAVAKLLGVRQGSPLLQLRRTYFNKSDEPIEHTELLCRPDRYQQVVDFTRSNEAVRRAI